MSEVLKRIARIRAVFLDSQLFFAEHKERNAVINHLEKLEPEFRSIAYEAVSMCIALADIENEKQLSNWLLYANGPALIHKPQVYIGLGWAIAKLNLPYLSIVNKIETGFCYRVVDGCGYYDGSFRQRHTVMSQQLPVYLPATAIPMYDQGLGRSLWYSSKADIDVINNKIESFAVERQKNFWRGIGIAVAYVGGCDEKELKKIFDHAKEHSVQLAYGAALAVRSRMKANTLTKDTSHCSHLWFKLATDQTSIDEQAYLNWIAQIEEQLANSF